jgi:tRNA pseudouridine55 synthase
VISGFFVIDKPAGISSHDVVSRVRRILGTRKVGHTGTLDPFATGVLPVAVNDATKVIPFLDEGVKCYQALLRLGVVTDTLDMTGRILAEGDYSSVSRERFLELLTRFCGVISQVPPMFSAIKRDGQPLYKLARQGIEVERRPRQVEIHSLELLSFEPPLACLRVSCSRGTYVRSLADDLGAELGCGASLQELRRIASGPFQLSNAITLAALEEAREGGTLDALCLDPFAALAHLPDIPLSYAGLAKVRHGRSPEWGDTLLCAPCEVTGSGLARLSRNGTLVAVARIELLPDAGSRLVLKRVFCN